MRWIKTLGVVGLGGLVIMCLPHLGAQSNKNSKTKSPSHRAKQVKRTTPRAMTVEPKNATHIKRKLPPKMLQPRTKVVARPQVRVVAGKKVAPKGKKKLEKIMVACRMVLSITGMT